MSSNDQAHYWWTVKAGHGTLPDDARIWLPYGVTYLAWPGRLPVQLCQLSVRIVVINVHTLRTLTDSVAHSQFPEGTLCRHPVSESMVLLSNWRTFALGIRRFRLHGGFSGNLIQVACDLPPPNSRGDHLGLAG